MEMSISDADTLVALLSRERLHALIELTGSEAEAIKLHQETLSVGAHLMKVIATVEIALRNAVSDNLTGYFAVPNWLQQPPVSFRWKEPERKKIAMAIDSAKRAEYSKLSQSDKAHLDGLAYPAGRPANTSHLRRAKDRRKQISVSEGKVIAEMTLYFWKRLYGPEYEQSLWKTTLKRTFPNKKVARATIASNLEFIYQARNRLAHHEPVLHKRFSDTLSAINFIAGALQTVDPENGTALLRLLADDMSSAQSAESALSAKLNAFRSSGVT
jgi:hypothetical protein